VKIYLFVGDLASLGADFKNQIEEKKSVSFREGNTNYLGFSNKHQPPMYKLLTKEATKVR